MASDSGQNTMVVVVVEQPTPTSQLPARRRWAGRSARIGGHIALPARNATPQLGESG